MEAIFGTKDFVNTSGAGGGDFNTPGSTEYQHLHSDGGGGSKGPDTYPDVKMEYRNDGTRHRLALDAPENPNYRYQIMNTRDLPVREYYVTANVSQLNCIVCLCVSVSPCLCVCLYAARCTLNMLRAAVTTAVSECCR